MQIYIVRSVISRHQAVKASTPGYREGFLQGAIRLQRLQPYAHLQNLIDQGKITEEEADQLLEC